MSRRNVSLLIALGTAFTVQVLCLVGLFGPAEKRIYDLFLRFRPPRERFEGVVFLDVDDQAVAHIGVFPWPRSVMAGGFLRLKDYGARAAILDIEYVDTSPARVDELYLGKGLRMDIERSFAALALQVGELLDAISAGRIRPAEASSYAAAVLGLAGQEAEKLDGEIRALRQDQDLYLARAALLFGRAWLTLNIQSEPLSGEQAERRSRAEELFSLPVAVEPGAFDGRPGADILPVIPPLMETARGAGFTNILIDSDGVRRRVSLVRRVGDFWYPQLAFAPLLEYLGNPALELRRGELVLRGARFPAGSGPGTPGWKGGGRTPGAEAQPETRDLHIPLDQEGAMLLDWPLEPYFESYTHISFAEFSRLEEAELLMEQYLSSLALVDPALFPGLAGDAQAVLDDFARAVRARNRALETGSGEDFAESLEWRRRGMTRLQKLLDGGAGDRAEAFAEARPDLAAEIREEAAWLSQILLWLSAVRDRHQEIDGFLREKLAGKFCVIGRADTGTTDIGVNPFHAAYINVGTHAAVLDTILPASFIRSLPSLWSVLLCFLPVLVLAGIYRFKPGLRIILGFGGAVFMLLGSWLLFLAGGLFLGPLGPVLAVMLAVIVQETLAFVSSEREKQFIRKAFSTYLSGEVVEELISDPSRLQLGGAKRHMSAVFTDVRGFSTISEKMDPEDLVRLLNHYLSAMSNVLLAEKGTIDKYEGDAIIAFFGAPLELPDHALRAATAAVRMKRLERELNSFYREEGLAPAPLFTRIGINTGNMVVGNMGTEQKMDYTIMGNAVNLASRLEGVNKQYGTWILASEATVLECGSALLCRQLDRVRVVGIQEPVRLHEILELEAAAPPEMKEKVRLFHGGLEFFEARDYRAAQEAFLNVLSLDGEDGPARIFLERCEKYREHPPAPDWDGVVNLSEK